MLILGSSSPRRLDLLRQVGIVPDKVIASKIDESVRLREKPIAYVKRMSLEKSLCVKKNASDYLITADTIVVVGLRIIGKPKNIDHAYECLQLLSGRRHRVYSAVTVSYLEKKLTKTVCTFVQFKRLSRLELDFYLSSNEWQGKAGAYAIQGLASRFVKKINGSYSNVVGLPVLETLKLLSGLGYKVI